MVCEGPWHVYCAMLLQMYMKGATDCLHSKEEQGLILLSIQLG